MALQFTKIQILREYAKRMAGKNGPQETHRRPIPETHPGPPCREGGKDKETLSNLPIERVEVGLLAFLFRLPQAAFVLSSLPTGRVGVGLRGESPVGLLWVSGVGP